MQTTKQTIEVDDVIPAGFRPVRYGKIPPESLGVSYLQADGTIGRWPLLNGSTKTYLILEPDPTYIDTTTEEYRVEVYRQWLRGKSIQYHIGTGDRWLVVNDPSWRWDRCVIFRVEPEGTDELGPYYLDGTRKVYVPR